MSELFTYNRKYSNILSNKSMPARIYFEVENMNDSFRVCKDSAILNRAVKFPINLVSTKMRIFTNILNVH